jgi:hypothetical protein
MPLEQPQTLIEALRNSKPPHELLGRLSSDGK